ncbi:TonB-dependent receptor [Gilvimarinus polysaccharolyticus]|uniref:TonB-dependent receptor n=1 Tax=Gilvimarinus polysaccharolyticus TaxID=863921 RepID=UPI000673895B|nr:TonB-dependent receptor [Gilvimarinus polysaccharolyticus]
MTFYFGAYRPTQAQLRSLCASAVLMASLPSYGQVERIESVLVVGEALSGMGNIRSEDIDGAFGLGQTLADIGRSITPITEGMLTEAAIDNLQQLQRVAPNTFQAKGFGAPSLPTLRGQLGELFSAGMRRQAGNNGLGIPLSFNSVGQIDIVRGTPSVILGTTQRTGGFVNITPKRADLTASEGRFSLSAGEWDQYGGQLDYAWVIDPERQGARISVEHKDEGSFYDYAGLDSTNLFASYRLVPNEQTEWNVSLEYYDVEWTDNAGINRPTQNLIDHGLYVQGQGVQPNGSTVPGAFALVSPTGEIKIPRSTVMTHPDDINGAKTALLHSVLSIDLGDSLRLVNRSYYEHLEREEIAQNSFVEIIDGADSFENRLELHYRNTIVGATVRYNDVLGYSQFSTEADLPSDLTGPLSNREIPLSTEQQARLVQLRPGLFVSPGAQYDLNNDGLGDFNLSDTTDSTSVQTGLFIQHQQALSERLQLTLGARGDWYDVTARDPIAPAAVTAARDSHNDFLKAGEATLHYRATAALAVYATGSYSESTSNSMAGGTVLGGDNKIDSLNFATENTLYELGVKYAPAGSPWYADVAAFEQTRSLRNRDGSNSGIATRGVEAQLFYRGDDAWASVGANWLEAKFDNSAAFQVARQVSDTFDNSRPDIIQGTGVGAPNSAAFAVSNQRLQGLPEWSTSAAGGYQLSDNWSVGGSLVVTGAYPLDYLQTVTVGEQFTINANVVYEFNQGASRIRLDVFNLTDEENWTPVFEGGYFGSSLVFPEQPRYVQAQFTQYF